MTRVDQSDFIIHFTKGKPSNTNESAYQNFKKILADEKILAGNYMIKGDFKCICFTEAPIGCLFQNSNEKACNTKYFNRYSPFGFHFSKQYIYKQGGRHVIYSDEDDYDKLPEDLKWRYVRYNPLINKDFTWEREWRLHKNELIVDKNSVKLVFPNKEWIDRFVHEHELELHGNCQNCICQRKTTIYNFHDLFSGSKKEVIENTCPNPSEFPYILINMDVKYDMPKSLIL